MPARQTLTGVTFNPPSIACSASNPRSSRRIWRHDNRGRLSVAGRCRRRRRGYMPKHLHGGDLRPTQRLPNGRHRNPDAVSKLKCGLYISLTHANQWGIYVITTNNKTQRTTGRRSLPPCLFLFPNAHYFRVKAPKHTKLTRGSDSPYQPNAEKE